MHLRQADVEEVTAMHGPYIDLCAILDRAIAVSTRVWTGVAPDGEPVSLIGVAPVSLLGGIGAPWALTTERIYEQPRSLVQAGLEYIPIMLSQYPRLVNYVDARNTRSIRWLKRMSFALHPAQPAGHAGLPFHKFTMGFPADV